MQVLPGIEELLAECAARRDVVLGLLTGNWHGGARIKLARFGLERYFAFGAFGEDGLERSELPPVALERAFEATGRRFAPHQTLIVGDSVRDVECARANGMPVLAVATGWTPAEVLARAGADRVVGLAGRASTYFPDFMPDYSKDITIQHLLNNSSGMEANIGRTDDNGNGLMPEVTAITFNEVLEKFKDSKLKFEPGTVMTIIILDTFF